MFFVTVAGHLGKDPETRFTPTGQKVTTFSLAVNQRKGKEDVTVWVRITIWGDRFDKLISYLKKGSGIVVSGKLNPPTTYVDKEGRTQVTLEITAEMIEFSPFGKTDRQAEGGSPHSAGQEGTGQFQADRGQHSQSQNPQFFSQTSGQGSYAPHHTAQNTPHSSQASGEHYSHSSVDEDNLPF